MMTKILIANRGAIACRITRTIAALGKSSVAVFAEDDVGSMHVDAADEAVSLGEGSVKETYLNQSKILEIAQKTGCQAIHPGYGFLSENAEFERRCAELGIAFLGPTSAQMEVFGLKHKARELAASNQVPMLSGSPLLADVETAKASAGQTGYPVMLKSTAGGGGIGMRICHSESELVAAFDAVQKLAANNFGDGGVFLERYVETARHVEVQVIGDGKGGVLALGTRDCSVQRRQQKVIEECPAPNIPETVADDLCRSAESLLADVNYRGVGTVEYIYDDQNQEAFFLEVNTRLQVEHGVTEMVFGIDLVACMIQLADGTLPSLAELKAKYRPEGHAIQARIYAEDPEADFMPSPGLLSHITFPDDISGLRVDTWVSPGTEVSPNYDPMIAKMIFHGDDRATAIEGLRNALSETTLYGTATNLNYLTAFLRDSAEFSKGELATSILSGFAPELSGMRVLRGGTFTTIQDYPGREGYWDVGVPPSGPFDSLSFQIGNRLLNNSIEAAGLEITLDGPSIEFTSATAFVLTGADMSASLDGQDLSNWRVYHAEAGSILDIGKVLADGLRGYLLLAGGINVPSYLGSLSTFTLGQFGGHCGRTLRPGDSLPLPRLDALPKKVQLHNTPFASVDEHHWELDVIYGPHGAPDFFTESDIETFFSTNYEVHFNSGRTGVRLIGPKPDWSRSDGGEAGLHPSNIHDNAYAVGAVDFTGDMPVLLGPDGPSLGGFVCPATVIRADLWKLGQLRPGDTVRFRPVSHEHAMERLAEVTSTLSSLDTLLDSDLEALQPLPIGNRESAVLDKTILPSGIELVFRPSGDDFLLLELGEQKLDIEIRFKIHGIYLALAEQAVDGLMELTPGIRSLQVHYVPEVISRDALIEVLKGIANSLDDEQTLEVPSRIIHLPLSWDDPVCHEAIDKYVRTVRPDAPWCPSNLDFIRRINGLDDILEVQNIVFDATYLVMGLGDVYLGAPVATPLNPEHRLVTTKYNPARTWTAENSVGIGGAYLCVYGMEGPGGYQFVGRTLQMWNRYRQTSAFTKPWLLRFFDQIKFYPVTESELLELRRDFVLGRFQPKIEQTSFSLGQHRESLATRSAEIESFTAQRQAAFGAEMEDWRRTGQLQFDDQAMIADERTDDIELPEGCFLVESAMSGNVWQYQATPGDTLNVSDILLVLESMKMELEVTPDRQGRLVEFLVRPGQQVTSGQPLAVFAEVS